jgi:hypothetical protein
MQPAHQPVAASIVHTLVQGLGISDAIDDEAYAATARRAKTGGILLWPRARRAQYFKRA